MELLLITARPGGDAARRLVAAAYAQGHRCRVVNGNVLRVAGGGRVLGPRGPLPEADAWHARPGAGGLDPASVVALALDSRGLPALNRGAALVRAMDLVAAQLALEAAGVAVVPWCLAWRVEHVRDLAGRGPWTVAPAGGPGRRAEVVVRSRASLGAVTGVLAHGAGPVLVRERQGTAVRAWVVDGRVVAWLGGTRAAPRVIRPPRGAGRTAVAAAEVLGLDVCGVDLRVGTEGARVESVTPCPALDAPMVVEGVDVAAAVVRAWTRRARGG